MKPNAVSRINQMVAFVRENRAVPFGQLCAKMNFAPATMYGYIRMLKNLALDVKYEDGLFIYTGDQKIEELTSQRRLTNQ